MGLFTEKEMEYLQQQALGRLATSGKTGMPQRRRRRGVGSPTPTAEEIT
jgi:hypothetical protein